MSNLVVTTAIAVTNNLHTGTKPVDVIQTYWPGKRYIVYLLLALRVQTPWQSVELVLLKEVFGAILYSRRKRNTLFQTISTSKTTGGAKLDIPIQLSSEVGIAVREILDQPTANNEPVRNILCLITFFHLFWTV